MQESGSINEVWLVWVSATTRVTWRVWSSVCCPCSRGPSALSTKGHMADSCQEIPKNKIWVRGSAKAKKGLKMGMGKGHRDRVLWQRRGSRGRPVLETTRKTTGKMAVGGWKQREGSSESQVTA